jgi:DNA-binding MarR family transcriptional regulator
MEPHLYPIVRRIKRLEIMHRLCVQRASVKEGVHLGQPPILAYIAEHEGCIQREIADALQVSPASIAASLKRMQRSGLIQKDVDSTDLRSNRLRLTEKGQAAMQRSRQACDAVDQRMFEGFSQEELSTFCHYLDRLIDNLSGEEFRGKSFPALLAEFYNHREEA